MGEIDLRTRRRYQRILQRHRGSQAAFERSLKPPVSHTAMWQWFRGGMNSQRIEKAIPGFVRKLENGKL